MAGFVGAGFIGGIVGGLIAGFAALWISRWKVPQWFRGLMPVVVIPLLASLIVGLLMGPAGHAFKLFFLICIAVAGLVGAATSSRKILFVQTVPALAAQMSNTRSAAALELWRPHLEGALVAIGNAPTALFHLLNMLQDPGCPRPAAIIGCPVGFVGARESKDALWADQPVPCCIVEGRLGGSAITVAAVNAIASRAE